MVQDIDRLSTHKNQSTADSSQLIAYILLMNLPVNLEFLQINFTFVVHAQSQSFAHELFISFDKIILGITRDCPILASTDIKS